MKKQVNNNENIISSLFTDKELEELNFSEEELATLEEAELISRAADVVPSTEKEIDAFYKKLDALFPDNLSAEEHWERYVELQKTDPKFLEQIVAVSALLDTVEEFPPATAEKVSLEEVMGEKQSIADEEKSAKLARVKAILDSIKE